jgi:hypothetical protein
VTEFVQNNAKEKKQDEHYAASGSGRSASTVITEAQPNDQQQERDVNAQLNPGDADDGNRPAHNH